MNHFKAKRPDLLEKAPLTAEDRAYLAQYAATGKPEE